MTCCSKKFVPIHHIGKGIPVLNYEKSNYFYEKELPLVIGQYRQSFISTFSNFFDQLMAKMTEFRVSMESISSTHPSFNVYNLQLVQTPQNNMSFGPYNLKEF